MSHVTHHAIIVVSELEPELKRARRVARSIFPNVSKLLPGVVNGCQSFFIPPDGSKEGRIESLQGDERREQFLDFCKTMNYEDGSNPLDIHVAVFGELEG